jgi:hypothetical protein
MIFPFTAIVGQEEMKTALILNVIDPSIGGLPFPMRPLRTAVHRVPRARSL